MIDGAGIVSEAFTERNLQLPWCGFGGLEVLSFAISATGRLNAVEPSFTAM